MAVELVTSNDVSTTEQNTEKHFELPRVKSNTKEFTPNSIKILIKHFYSNLGIGLPSTPSVILIGPPGVGKSTAVRESALEIANQLGLELIDITSKEERDRVMNSLEKCLSEFGDPETCRNKLRYFVFLDLRLTEVEPTDLIGYPYRDGNRMEYAPPSWAYILHYLPGILFLDEISNVRRSDVLAASYKILLDKAAGFLKFNDRVLVVAAGNLPEHAPDIAQSLPPPIINRSSVIYVTSPSLDEWFNWMIKSISALPSGIREELYETLKIVYNFLSMYPGYFMNFEFDPHKNENFPTPRSWSHLVFSLPISFIRSLSNFDVQALEAIIATFVGSKASSAILPFMIGATAIPIDDIIRNPDKLAEIVNKAENMEEKLDRLIGAVSLLGFRIVEYRLSETVAKNLYNKVHNVGSRLLGAGAACSLVKSLRQSANDAVRLIITSPDLKKVIENALKPLDNLIKEKCPDEKPKGA